MKFFHATLFVMSLLLLSWLLMQVVHELGHVLGAWATGGTIERVVLHPLVISRTDISPNPSPLIVVWSGPILGCFIPLFIWFIVSKKHELLTKILQFFAGFCCVANGAYLLFGQLDQIGDCGTMTRCGTPSVVMTVYGTTALLIGLVAWHRLGSPTELFVKETSISGRAANVLFGLLLLTILIEMALTPLVP